MQIELTAEEASELQQLLHGALSELSHEIADTDNAQYRQGLRDRRTALNSIMAQLEPSQVD